MVEQIPGKTFTLAADGDATGFANITSNTGAYPGAVGFLTKADGSVSQKVILTELKSTDQIGLRFIPEAMDDVKLTRKTITWPSGGRSNLSAFATGSLLIIEDQLVRVRQPIFDPVPKI